MSAQNDQPPSLTDRFRAAYDKLWWPIVILFFGGFIWLGFTGRILLLIGLFGGLFAAVGLHALLYGWWSRTQARRSEYWFLAEGRVLSSQVEVRTDTSSDSPRTAIDTYWPSIEYEYEFQGETYRSDRIILVEVNYPRKQAEALVARNPVGARPGLCGPQPRPAGCARKGARGPNAYNNLGEVLEQRGDLQAALEEYRKACDLAPKDPTSCSASERLRKKLKN